MKKAIAILIMMITFLLTPGTAFADDSSSGDSGSTEQLQGERDTLATRSCNNPISNTVHLEPNGNHDIVIPVEAERSGALKGWVAHSDGHIMRVEWQYPDAPQIHETVVVKVNGHRVARLGDLPEDVDFTKSVKVSVDAELNQGTNNVTIRGGGDSQYIQYCLRVKLDKLETQDSSTPAPTSTTVPERAPVNADPVGDGSNELAITGPTTAQWGGIIAASLIVAGGLIMAVRRFLVA